MAYMRRSSNENLAQNGNAHYEILLISVRVTYWNIETAKLLHAFLFQKPVKIPGEEAWHTRQGYTQGCVRMSRLT